VRSVTRKRVPAVVKFYPLRVYKKAKAMLGAIIGDIVGSVYEGERVKTTDFALLPRFSRFTDDMVLTVAIADAILQRGLELRTAHRWRYKAIPAPLVDQAMLLLDHGLKDVLRAFQKRYNVPY
jgi:ADP-ribosylglycohydrolase